MPADLTQFKRNRRIATGFLVAMTAVFVATLLVPDAPNWVRFIHAVAEAGMIGGLADWFAVAALFRHPLGIPIPHTALLPKSKDRIASNIGDFITQHFMKPDLIRQKLQDINIAAALKDWLLVPENSRLIADKAAGVIKANLDDTGNTAVSSFVKIMLHNLLMRPQREKFIADMIRKLATADLRGEMTDYALRAVRSLLDENRDSITALVQDRSRWWIASSADRRLSKMLIDEMIGVIDSLLEPGSNMRVKLDTALLGFATDDAQAANISRTVQTLLLHLVESDEFDGIVATFIRGLKRSLDDDMNGESGHTIAFIETTLLTLARKLDTSPEDLAAANLELSAAAGDMAARLSATASTFIATTIQAWDADEMVTLFEEQVGSDLQFIRMNGTLLGGLIGGALFFVTEAVQLIR